MKDDWWRFIPPDNVISQHFELIYSEILKFPAQLILQRNELIQEINKQIDNIRAERQAKEADLDLTERLIGKRDKGEPGPSGIYSEILKDEHNVLTCRVLKNRFSGDTGIATTLIYNKDTGRLSEGSFDEW